MRLSIATCLLLGTSLCTVTAPAFAQDSSGGIAEIIVTAQKREQSLQDVPVSITALNTDMLEANRVRSVGDLNAIAPNVTVRQSAGGAGIPAFVMRGALSIGVGPGADREVGYYVDGVYIGHANGSMFELADIQRMEVLRGPQGTLFGRNATAGAISILTADPKGTFAAKQEFTVGNYDQFRAKTRIDLPAFGPFSAAVTYTHSERRGEVRNLGAGTKWDYTTGGKGILTSPKWLGNENTDAVAAALKFDNNGDMTASYKFDWMDFDGTPTAQGFAGLGVTSLLGPAEPLLLGILASQPNSAILTPTSTKRPDAVNNAYSTAQTMRVSGHNLTVNWRATDSLSFKNVLAIRDARQFSSFELGGMGGLALYGPLAAAFGVPNGTPFELAGSHTQYKHHQFSEEFQINYDSELLSVTAGFLHYFQRQSNGGLPGLSNTLQITPLLPNASGAIVIPPSAVCDNPADVSTCGGPFHTKGKSDAGYIQAEVHVTPELDIVGGYRITRDKKQGYFHANSFNVTDTNPSYLLGINYKPTREIMVYAKYSSAFMSGGGNTGTFSPGLDTYKPEFAYSWEAGIKADLLNRKLRTNLSVFTVKYADLQFITSGQACGDPSIGVCVYNAGDARAKGFEFEATALPVDGLTLGVGVGYTDFKYLSISPIATGATGTFEPHLRSKWTSNLSAQYDTPPMFGDAHLTFRVDANFRSKTRLTPEAPAAFASLVTNPSIWILNSRIALSDINVAGHKAEVALWGRNLTNDDHMAFLNSYYFVYPANYERARTYGLDVKFEF